MKVKDRFIDRSKTYFTSQVNKTIFDLKVVKVKDERKQV